MVAAQYKVYVPLGAIKGNRYGYYPPRLNAEVLPELTAVRAEFLMLGKAVPSVGEVVCLVLGHPCGLVPSSDTVHPAEVAHESTVSPPPIPLSSEVSAVLIGD